MALAASFFSPPLPQPMPNARDMAAQEYKTASLVRERKRARLFATSCGWMWRRETKLVPKALEAPFFFLNPGVKYYLRVVARGSADEEEEALKPVCNVYRPDGGSPEAKAEDT
jgi:hypothetical protein